MQKKNSDDLLLIDAHVHIHDCFYLDKFFDSAYRNFKNAARNYFNSENFKGILCLTESFNADYFVYLKEQTVSRTQYKNFKNIQWKTKPAEDESAIIIEKNEQDRLIVIAGRQVITKEKLEVLAIGTTKKFADGLSLNDLIQKIQKENAIPVLPWGVGKWIGNRGEIVRQFIKNNSKDKYFLGDNAGRPAYTPMPKLFKLAGDKKIKILRGSDPLALKSQEKKAGSFGFGIQGIISYRNPEKDLKRILWESDIELFNFGKLEFPLYFFKNQILIHLRNRIGKRFK